MVVDSSIGVSKIHRKKRPSILQRVSIVPLKMPLKGRLVNPQIRIQPFPQQRITHSTPAQDRIPSPKPRSSSLSQVRANKYMNWTAVQPALDTRSLEICINTDQYEKKLAEIDTTRIDSQEISIPT